jgi:PST family polysaccharide transporter
MGELWSFSIWTFFRSIGNYLNSQVDQVVVGGFGGASLMGRYAVATDVAQSPGREINEPMVAVLYPVMSRLQNDMPALREVYLRTLGWTAFICASTGVGVALVAPDMQRLVLGDKWIGIAPLMSWLAIGGAIAGLSSGAYGLFDALNQPRTGARMIWVRLVVLGIAILPVAIWTKNLVDIAICRAVGEALFLPGLFHAIHRLTGISFGQFIKALYRPLLASAVMAVSVIAANLALSVSGNYRFIIDVCLGAVVFLSSAWLLWRAAGRPHSPENGCLRPYRKDYRLRPIFARN